MQSVYTGLAANGSSVVLTVLRRGALKN